MSVKAQLSQTPDSKFGVPMPGQERWFKIEGDRAKNESGGDYGGQLYKIVGAERQADWTKEIDGNTKTFNAWKLTLEPAQNGASDATGATVTASNGRSGGRDLDARIARQVAFKGAVELAITQVQNGKLKIEDAADFINERTEELVAVVEGRSNPKPDPIFEETEAADTTQPNPDDLF